MSFSSLDADELEGLKKGIKRAFQGADLVCSTHCERFLSFFFFFSEVRFFLLTALVLQKDVPLGNPKTLNFNHFASEGPQSEEVSQRRVFAGVGVIIGGAFVLFQLSK